MMARAMTWNRKHLLDIESLAAEEITTVLDTARAFKAVGERAIKKVLALRGKTVVNLFIEPSTRTRISFELAALRLTADVINFTAEASSLKKGETLKDTARNLEAVNADIMIIRPSTLVPRLFEQMGCRVTYDVEQAIANADIINLLRIQHERQRKTMFPSLNEYTALFGLNKERLARTKPDVIIMHPGPINRGVEI